MIGSFPLMHRVCFIQTYEKTHRLRSQAPPPLISPEEKSILTLTSARPFTTFQYFVNNLNNDEREVGREMAFPKSDACFIFASSVKNHVFQFLWEGRHLSSWDITHGGDSPSMSAVGILAAAIGPGDSRRKLKPLCSVEGKDHRGWNPEYNHPLPY